jgi:hypothetical protein
MTANVSLGNTFYEPMPFNSAGFGNQGWPTINFQDKTCTLADQKGCYIDPLTGILIVRVTGPGENQGQSKGYGITSTPGAAGSFNYVLDINSAWTNPSNVLSGSQNTTATYSGTTQDPLFISWDTTGLPELLGFSQWQLAPGGNAQPTLDNVQLAAFGTGTAGIEACLSFYDSGATCNSNWYLLNLPSIAPTPATLASAVQPSAASFPNGGAWAGWNVTPLKDDVSVYSGNYSSSGTLVTTTSDININWKTGARIYLSGTNPTCPANVCTLAAPPATGNTFTITQNIGTTSGTFRSYAAGVVIRKHTTDASTVNVSLSSAYTISQQFANPNDGNNQVCSSNPVTVSYAADGVTPITPTTAFICSFAVSANPGLWLFMDTGETRLLDPLYFDNSTTVCPGGLAGCTKAIDVTIANAVTGQGCGYNAKWISGTFDNVNANKLYLPFSYNTCSVNQVIPGHSEYVQPANSIMSMTYNTGKMGCVYGSYAHSLYPPKGYRAGQNTGLSNNTGWTDTCIAYDATAFSLYDKTWVDARVVGGAPNWTNALQSWTGAGVYTSRLGYGKLWSASGPGAAGDNGVANWVIDATTGHIDFFGSTFGSTLGALASGRFSVQHTNNIFSGKNTFNVQMNEARGNESNGFPNFGGFMTGPWRFTPTQMYKSGAYTSDTSLPASTFTQGALTGSAVMACPNGLPANVVAQGATGNNCIKFQTQQPCSRAPVWKYNSFPNEGTTHTTTSIAAGVTTIPFSAFASTAGMTAGTYLYISNFNIIGKQTTEGAYAAVDPGFELIYINSVNGGASTFTVTRGVNGIVADIPAYSNAPYPNPFNGVDTTGKGNGKYVGAVYVMNDPSAFPGREADSYPCEWGPTDIGGKRIYSQVASIQPGDQFTAWARAGYNGGGEYGKFQVASVTPLGGANYEIVASWVPTGEINQWANAGTSTNAWLTGWSGVMAQPKCCAHFVNTTNLAAGWYPEYAAGGHGAYGVTAGTSYANYVSAAPYSVWYHQPIMSSSNINVVNPATYSFTSDPGFAGSAPVYPYQSYPSQQQFAITDNNNGRWAFDWHTLNPSNGTSSAVQGGLTGSSCNTGTLVGGAGATTVWKYTGCTSPYKLTEPHVFAGRWLFKDVSSPSTGNIITDSTPYQFCYAYAVNECRTGSAVGDIYMTVPQPAGALQGGSYLGHCIIGGIQENTPCAIDLQFHGGGLVQFAIDSGNPLAVRKLTTGFTLPGQQWVYAAGEASPNGKWMFFNCFYCSGVRTDVYAAQLPNFPSGQVATTLAGGFVTIPFTLPPSGAYDQARVRFGYAENGTPSTNALYCTPRADGCTSSLSVSPFAFLSENNGWQTCNTGCTVSVAAIPGRMLYHVIERRNSNSGLVSTSDLRVIANR